MTWGENCYKDSIRHQTYKKYYFKLQIAYKKWILISNSADVWNPIFSIKWFYLHWFQHPKSKFHLCTSTSPQPSLLLLLLQFPVLTEDKRIMSDYQDLKPINSPGKYIKLLVNIGVKADEWSSWWTQLSRRVWMI